jgi:hypothetical protein
MWLRQINRKTQAQDNLFNFWFGQVQLFGFGKDTTHAGARLFTKLSSVIQPAF